MQPDWRERLAWWMDEAFVVPGTRMRIGLDAIIGLFPGAGDWLMGLVQAGLVLSILLREEVPYSVGVRMVINVLIDTAVGTIPLVGDVFDAFFKANTRNIRLLRKVEEERRRTGRVSAKPHLFWLAGLVLVLLAGFTLMAAGALFVVSVLLQTFGLGRIL